MTIQGSKNKYSKYIIPILQKCINENNIKVFVDCCVGGSNIIKNITALTRIGIDKNSNLIALYHAMQKPDFVFPPFPSKEDWDKCKNGEIDGWYAGLVEFFTSYLARGFDGGYNKQERQYWGRVHTMQKELQLIKDIVYIEDDFNYILSLNNCVIYSDPPYINTKKYSADKNFDYNRFWNTIREASLNNYVFVSEQVAPEDFISIWSMDTERQLQGNKTKCVENLFVFKDGLSAKFML